MVKGQGQLLTVLLLGHQWVFHQMVLLHWVGLKQKELLLYSQGLGVWEGQLQACSRTAS